MVLDLINLVVLALVSFYICTNALHGNQLSVVILGPACFLYLKNNSIKYSIAYHTIPYHTKVYILQKIWFLFLLVCREYNERKM